MKKPEFNRIIESRPQGAQAYKKHMNSVVFYRNIDSEHGSFDELYWFSGDNEPHGEWFTRRRFLNMSGVVSYE